MLTVALLVLLLTENLEMVYSGQINLGGGSLLRSLNGFLRHEIYQMLVSSGQSPQKEKGPHNTTMLHVLSLQQILQ